LPRTNDRKFEKSGVPNEKGITVAGENRQSPLVVRALRMPWLFQTPRNDKKFAEVDVPGNDSLGLCDSRTGLSLPQKSLLAVSRRGYFSSKTDPVLADLA